MVSNPLRQRCLIVAVVVPALVMAIGCSPTIRWPNLLHPGTAQQQRAEALVHDPYPLDDVGPPIVGGRPPGYQQPVPEVVRARQFVNSLPGAGRVPVYAPAPAIQAPPLPNVPAPSAPPVPQGYVPAPSPQPAPVAPTPPPFRY
jgi:hypothetical protein